MKNKRAYIMRSQKWSQYFNRDGEVVCFKCGEDINIGDAVVPRMQRRKVGMTIVRLYCIRCGDELNLLTDEEVKMSTRDRVYQLLSSIPKTTTEIAEELSMKRATTLDALNSLWNRGKAKRVGWRRFKRLGGPAALWVKDDDYSTMQG